MSSRTQPPSDIDKEAAAFGHARGRRHRDDQIKLLTIPDVAERLNVSTRTVRRRVDAGDLVVHRIGRVVRISEGDLRVFLALHRKD